MTQTPGVPDTQRDNTCTAIALGWQTAMLYLDAISEDANADAAGDPPALPGRGSLRSPFAAAALQLEAGITRLGPLLTGAGLSSPVLNKDDADLDKLSRDDLTKRVLAFNEDVIRTLTAADFRVGKGYTLGRKLANVSRLPLVYTPGPGRSTEDPGGDEDPGDDEDAGAAAGTDIREELSKVCGWIEALRSVLPDHAAKPVLDGIDLWQAWLYNPIDADGRACSQAGSLPPSDARSVEAALGKQVRLWRALLTGEKSALDTLSADSYFDSAEEMVSIYKRMVSGFLRHWWPYLLAIAGGLAAVVTVLFVYGQGRAGAIGTLVAALAAVGVTGRTVSATLSKTAETLGRSLIDAELDGAAGLATCRLPFGIDPAMFKARVDDGEAKAAKATSKAIGKATAA